MVTQTEEIQNLIEQIHKFKEAGREGRYCHKCHDYNMDEEGYCCYCREKTGSPLR
jgi:recombinational DNA repair protein RecR